MVVLDIDMNPAEGKDGWFELGEAGIEVPETFNVATPSGGNHYFFRANGSERISPVAAPGITFRCGTYAFRRRTTTMVATPAASRPAAAKPSAVASMPVSGSGAAPGVSGAAAGATPQPVKVR